MEHFLFKGLAKIGKILKIIKLNNFLKWRMMILLSPERNGLKREELDVIKMKLNITNQTLTKKQIRTIV